MLACRVVVAILSCSCGLCGGGFLCYVSGLARLGGRGSSLVSVLSKSVYLIVIGCCIELLVFYISYMLNVAGGAMSFLSGMVLGPGGSGGWL
jgi:hypothetical protein